MRSCWGQRKKRVCSVWMDVMRTGRTTMKGGGRDFERRKVRGGSGEKRQRQPRKRRVA